MSPAASEMCQQKLEKLGVQVITNEKAIEQNGKMVRVSNQQELEAEQVILTVGFQAINSFMDPSLLDQKGYIKVDEFFRIEGTTNMMAVGDCCNMTTKAGNFIMTNGPIMGGNLQALLEGSNDKLVKYKEGFDLFVLTIGPNDGMFAKGTFYSQWILPWIKNKTMFIFAPKNEIGI